MYTHLIHDSPSPAHSPSQTAARSVSRFCTAYAAFVTLCCPVFFQNLPPSVLVTRPHLDLHGSLNLPDPPPHTTSISNQPFFHNALDRETGHGTRPVNIGCSAHSIATATWPNSSLTLNCRVLFWHSILIYILDKLRHSDNYDKSCFASLTLNVYLCYMPNFYRL